MAQSSQQELAPVLSLQVRDVVFRPALFAASGAADLAATDEHRRVSIERLRGFGAWVTKTMTLHARPSNPQPVVARRGNGSLVNSVGLSNLGIEESLMQLVKLQELFRNHQNLQTVVSLAGTADELADMVTMLDGVAWVTAIELNLSCPNTGTGVIPSGNPREAAVRVEAARSHTDRPIFAKLGPCCSDVAEVARAVECAGADAVVAGNTMPVRPLDDLGDPVLGGVDGGLSGRAVHDINVRLVAHAAEAVSIPVIGCGGVAGPRSAMRMIDAGARGIQIGTALHLEPVRVEVLVDDLAGVSTDPR